jgi:hypothetical protein
VSCVEVRYSMSRMWVGQVNRILSAICLDVALLDDITEGRGSMNLH